MFVVLITILIAFLLGAIPTGYLITKKFCEVDIRTKGSGNIGSTNVKRVAGRKISIITQVFDVLKGLIPVAIGLYVANFVQLPVSKDAYVSIIAIAAILGHDYTPFLNFNGGKGVNTTLGAFVLIAPIPTFIGVAVYFILKPFTKIVSIRSMALGVAIPIMSAILGLGYEIVLGTAVASILIIIRHKENIKRIINKEEK
jgi:glycerol-3-phosphate acyltransferase PlsY